MFHWFERHTTISHCVNLTANGRSPSCIIVCYVSLTTFVFYYLFPIPSLVFPQTLYTLNCRMLNKPHLVIPILSASDWEPVTVSVSQGSVLGYVLFIICLNYINVGLNNFVAKFANDTKIGNSVIPDS